MKGDKISQPCDRHINKTVSIRKHAKKYEHMQKWMVKFLQKFENRGIKIARAISIRIKN